MSEPVRAQLVALGRQVRRRRFALGLTLAQLAAKADISTRSLIDWEAGRRNPSLAGFLAVAAALGTSPRDLFSEGP